MSLPVYEFPPTPNASAASSRSAEPRPLLRLEPALDPVQLDPLTRELFVHGRPVALTYLEFELLAFLVAASHRVHTREAIVREVWGYDHPGDGRTVDVHIARLRTKLGRERGRLLTVRRVGYRFVPTSG